MASPAENFVSHKAAGRPHEAYGWRQTVQSVGLGAIHSKIFSSIGSPMGRPQRSVRLHLAQLKAHFVAVKVDTIYLRQGPLQALVVLVRDDDG